MSTYTISITVGDESGALGVINWTPTPEVIEKLEKLRGADRDNTEAAIENRMMNAMRQSVGVINALTDPD